MKRVVLALDLSISSTGYTFMDYNQNIIETGTIIPESYPLHTKDRYPVKTIKFIDSTVEQILELLAEYSLKYEIKDIVIEEINVGGLGGIKVIKGLSWIHGFLMRDLGFQDYRFHFLHSTTWRSAIGLKLSTTQKVHNKKVGKKSKDYITFKHLAVDKVNEIYGTELTLEDNDVADAVCICLAFLIKNKPLTF